MADICSKLGTNASIDNVLTVANLTDESRAPWLTAGRAL